MCLPKGNAPSSAPLFHNADRHNCARFAISVTGYVNAAKLVSRAAGSALEPNRHHVKTFKGS